MAIENFEVRLSVHLAWWVTPLIKIANFNHSIGIPVDPERIVQIIVRWGVKIKVA